MEWRRVPPHPRATTPVAPTAAGEAPRIRSHRPSSSRSRPPTPRRVRLGPSPRAGTVFRSAVYVDDVLQFAHSLRTTEPGDERQSSFIAPPSRRWTPTTTSSPRPRDRTSLRLSAAACPRATAPRSPAPAPGAPVGWAPPGLGPAGPLPRGGPAPGPPPPPPPPPPRRGRLLPPGRGPPPPAPGTKAPSAAAGPAPGAGTPRGRSSGPPRQRTSPPTRRRPPPPPRGPRSPARRSSGSGRGSRNGPGRSGPSRGAVGWPPCTGASTPAGPRPSAGLSPAGRPGAGGSWPPARGAEARARGCASPPRSRATSGPGSSRRG